MSRIDEVLTRSAAQDGPVAVKAVDAVAVPVSIDRYAPESAARPVEFPKPSPTAFESPVRGRGHISPLFAESLQGRLVVDADTLPVSVEQYRRIASALHEYQQQHGLKTFMISSAVPREGKTLTALNVALTLSQSYHGRVLLIDADLRRPSIQQSFGLPDGRGLGDVLATGGGSLPLTDVSSSLSVMIAGRPRTDPIGLLTSSYLRTLVADVAARFDWVVIDTPPVGALPDARLISNLCEGVLFVIDARSTPYDLVKRAIAELGPERIVGTVLNRIDEHTLPANDYYGYYTPRAD